MLGEWLKNSISDVGDTLSSFLDKMINGNTISYVSPDYQQASVIGSQTDTQKPADKSALSESDIKDFSYVPEGFKTGTPKEYFPVLKEVSNHSGLTPNKVRAIGGLESGETWDSKRKGSTSDYGIQQFTPPAIEEITKPRGKHGSFWEQNYGKKYGKFDINNPTHQMLAAGILFNYNKQFALPAVGIKNPTDEQVAVSYNMGAGGVADYVNGKLDSPLTVNGKPTTVGKQYKAYRDLMTRHGWDVNNKQ